MTQIVGGHITYSEQREPNVFGSPKAEAKFDFGVAEGEDYTAVANKAANEARRYVRVLIGLAKSGTTEVEAAGASAEGAGSPPPASAKAASATAATAPASTAATAAPAAVDDGFGAFLGEAVKPISDVELNDAIKAIHAKLKAKNPSAGAELRTVAQKYIGEGKPLTVSNIPQEHRQTYLDDLAKLAG